MGGPIVVDHPSYGKLALCPRNKDRVIAHDETIRFPDRGIPKNEATFGSMVLRFVVLPPVEGVVRGDSRDTAKWPEPTDLPGDAVIMFD